MLDLISDNLTFIFAFGIPSAVAVWQFVEGRKTTKLEQRKSHIEINAAEAEAKASDARSMESILASTNYIIRIMSDVKEQVSDGLMKEIQDLRAGLDTRFTTVEGQIATIQAWQRIHDEVHKMLNIGEDHHV